MLKKLLYGSTEIGINAVEVFIRLHLLVFYSKYVGLSTSSAGIAISISILWDAAIDPWIGRMSDQFRSQFGSRIHLVLAGAIGTTLSLVALFNPPHFESQTSSWFFLLLVSLIFNTSYGLFSIPYAAMIGDYQMSREERSSTIAYRFVFSNIGAILGIGIPGYFLQKTEVGAYQNSVWFIAIAVMTFALTGSLKPPPKFKASDIEQQNSSAAKKHPLLLAFSNRPFFLLLLAYCLINIAMTVNSSAALYFYRIRIQISEAEIQNVLLLFMLFFSASIPVWIKLAQKFEAKRTLLLGAGLLGIFEIITFPLLPVGQVQPIYIWACGVGGILAGSSVLLDSILSDTIDFDHALTKQEKFGLYFGIWKFGSKSSRAASLLITGLALDWANVAFPDIDTNHRLAILFGPGVGVFILFAVALAGFYPLNEKKCLQIKRILNLRKDRHNANA